jgi:hypothetical protein
MKQVKVAGLIFLMMFCCAPVATAQWSNCIGCHTGTIAPGEEALKEKFQTAEAFINAAMASKNPQMKEIQEHKKVIEAAAKDLALKDAETPEEKPVR